MINLSKISHRLLWFILAICCFVPISILPNYDWTIINPEQQLANMSLRAKIGQLMVVAAASFDDQTSEQLASKNLFNVYHTDQPYIEQLITNYQIGGVIFLYQSTPKNQIELTNRWQKMAQIPILVAQDSEWGLSMRLNLQPEQVVRYPHNLTLGAIADSQIIYNLGYEIGQQCRALGVYLNLAPVADVNTNRANLVIHDRAFGDDPSNVAKKAVLFMQGLQAAGILACAKHFPGHGNTSVDSHWDLPIIQSDLQNIDLVPFQALIAAGISSIMLGHLAFPSLDQTKQAASLSFEITTNWLQNQLGFSGLKITDGLGMGAVMQKYAPGYLEQAAFLAGNELILCPLDVPRAIDLIEQAVLSGQVTMQDLDQRVLKILKLKARLQITQKINIDQALAFITRPAAYALQAQAYRAALTQINQGESLDFTKQTLAQSAILQIGNLPDEHFAALCANQVKSFVKYQANFTEQDLKNSLKQIQNSSQIILVLGSMHKNAAQDFGIAKNVFELLKKLNQPSKEVVVILFGTPYSVRLFPTARTILVAYEDLAIMQIMVFQALSGAFRPIGHLPIKL